MAILEYFGHCDVFEYRVFPWKYFDSPGAVVERVGNLEILWSSNSKGEVRGIRLKELTGLFEKAGYGLEEESEISVLLKMSISGFFLEKEVEKKLFRFVQGVTLPVRRYL